MRTVTADPVTPRQPGVCVSVHSADGTHTLRVFRTRPLKNQWGGIGTTHPCDSDGTRFASHEDAWAFALERGYLQRHYTHLRPGHKALRRDPRVRLWTCESFPHWVGRIVKAERIPTSGMYLVTFPDNTQTHAVGMQMRHPARVRDKAYPQSLGYMEVIGGIQTANMDDGTTLAMSQVEWASTYDYIRGA